MAFNILGNDDDSITVEGPMGEPRRIAKAGLDPSYLSTLMGGAQAPAPAAAPFSADSMLGSLGPNINAPTTTITPPTQPMPEFLKSEALAPTPQPVVSPTTEMQTMNSPAAPVAPPAAQSAFDKGINQQQSAINTMGENAYVEGVRKAKEYQGLNDQMQAVEKQRLALQKQKEEDLGRLQKQIDQRSDEAAKNIPGKDFWADRSTESKIGAAISIGLGAVGAAMTGGENQALKIINNAIDTDMKRQVERYSALRGRVGDARDSYGLMLKTYGDKESALLASQEIAYKKAQIKLNQFAAMAESDNARAKAQQLSGGLEMQRGEAHNKLLAKQMERADQMRDTFVPSLGGYATSKEGAAKVNELAGAVSSAKDGLNKLEELSKLPSASVDPVVKARANTVADMTRAALRVPILGPGTVQEKEYNRLVDIVTDPTNIFSMNSTNMAKLKELRERLDANLMSHAKAYGLIPGQATQGQAPARVGAPRQ